MGSLTAEKHFLLGEWVLSSMSLASVFPVVLKLLGAQHLAKYRYRQI